MNEINKENSGAAMAAILPFMGDGPWRNDACMGYAILAMERAGLDYETMNRVLYEMKGAFDDTDIEGAAKKYNGGI